MIFDIFYGILMVIGALFMSLAGLGIIRMPDLYSRISAATKASTLGAAFLLLSVAVKFQEPAIVVRMIAVIFFIALTAPISAHIIGRTAYLTGIPLWEKSKIDEFKEAAQTVMEDEERAAEEGENPMGCL